MKDKLREEHGAGREKLSGMINDVLERSHPVSGNEEILTQSRKVDALLNRLQKEKTRDDSR